MNGGSKNNSSNGNSSKFSSTLLENCEPCKKLKAMLKTGSEFVQRDVLSPITEFSSIAGQGLVLGFYEFGSYIANGGEFNNNLLFQPKIVMYRNGNWTFYAQNGQNGISYTQNDVIKATVGTGMNFAPTLKFSRSLTPELNKILNTTMSNEFYRQLEDAFNQNLK